MQVAAVVDGAFGVLANVDGESEPHSKEEGPVNEFEREGEIVVASGAVDHARCQDPDEREDCPSTLFQVSCLLRGSNTAATVNLTSLHPVIFERVYAERDMTKTAKMNWITRRGRPHEVLPMVGWTAISIYDVVVRSESFDSAV
jgi:hypothetical protein